MAEFEFQIDELLHKLDVISDAAPPSSGAAPLPGAHHAAYPSSSGADTKDSSGIVSKSGTSSDRQHPHQQLLQQRHLLQQQLAAPFDGRRLGGVDDQLIYDHDWNQLVDLGNFESGLMNHDDDKVSRGGTGTL